MMVITGATRDAAHPALAASTASLDDKFLVFHFDVGDFSVEVVVGDGILSSIASVASAIVDFMTCM